jgi:nitroreductase
VRKELAVLLGKSVPTLVEQRYSCRSYQNTPIDPETRAQLEQFVLLPESGPFGTPVRFRLIAATEQDPIALRGLGTFGFIQGATGFVVGAVHEGERNLEDFGYRMETIILFCTALNLGTCWLGGTFRQSRFAAAMEIGEDEQLPAIAAVGAISDRRGFVDRLVRRQSRGATRHAWSNLFFDRQFGNPLSREAAAAYAVPLEAVRLAPSASNKQPWRIVRHAGAWHFYLQRTPGYRERNELLFRIADMQRIDMGIAMCHFAMTATERGLDGRWILHEPDLDLANEGAEYRASWLEEQKG